MRVVTDLPRPVRVIEHTTIPMPDGCRLAARLWLPEDSDTEPVPAVLEYIPYRKRDLTRARDEPMHRYFAGHGYAAVRVDVRGSGDSEGLLTDEYSEAELADGEAVIAWIAAQPWCTGAVGMLGKSWGGFNALQIAARRPPALKAIITVCASDDRYGDDAHYMGGCLLNENLTWGSVLLTLSALPPDPVLAGARWREAWLARLDALACFPAVWLGHQRRDAYWRRGSVGEDAGAIACPVYAVGGWADAYTNAVPRLVAGLAVPRQGLVGPWGHLYPQSGVPGPAIGFLQEALRWWERWLRGVAPPVDEPRYRVWMPEGDGFAGRWVAEAGWPSPRIQPRRWVLGRGTLEADGAPVAERRVEGASPQSVGLAAGDWCVFGGEGEMPADQREDDAASLTFDSAPLRERLEILGAPVAILDVTVDRPHAFVAVRLNEVRADGSVVRVTYGLRNLTHREDHARPTALEPGRRYRVRVALNDVAWSFAPGSRLRLAISTAYWPVVWPSPAAVRLTLFTGGSALELPVRPPNAADGRLRPFDEAEGARGPTVSALQPVRVRRTIERGPGDELISTIATEGSEPETASHVRLDAIDLAVEQWSRRRYRIYADDPLSARAEVAHRIGLRRGAWQVRVESLVEMWATRETFELRGWVEAREGDDVVGTRRWEASIPRDGV